MLATIMFFFFIFAKFNNVSHEQVTSESRTQSSVTRLRLLLLSYSAK